jgi:hypothetical protein
MDEQNLCSNFRATDFAYSRNRREVKDETGIFGLFCARHGTPLLFTDIYRGERYGYCDHLLAKILREYGEDRNVHLFYDVNCKYSVNFKVSLIQLTHQVE